jgi:hypothetical protein
MKFKIKSLALLTSVALYSVSPVEAGKNWYNEDYVPAHLHLSKLNDNSSVLFPREQEKNVIASHCRNQLAATRKFIAEMDENLTTEKPLRSAIFRFLQAEALSATPRTYALLEGNVEELSRPELREKNNVNAYLKDYFEEAKKSFEKVLDPKESEAFQKIYGSSKGGTIYLYAQTIRSLANLTEDKDEKISYLSKLSSIVEEMLKNPNQVVNAPSASSIWNEPATKFTKLAGGNRLNYGQLGQLDNYFFGNPKAVLLAINFEKEWIEHPQEGISFVTALVRHLNNQETLGKE